MKNKLTNKILAALLAMVLVLSLSACTGTATSSTGTASKADGTSSVAEENLYYNKTGYPICDTKINITIGGPNTQANKEEITDTLLVKSWEDKFGITATAETYTSDAWKTQMALLVSGDTLPDLILNGYQTESDVQKYGQNGYLADFSDYEELAPNMYAKFEQYPEYKAYLADHEGSIYGLSKYGATEHEVLNRVYMSQAWLDNLGLEVPTTTQELYNVLTAFKTQDANKNGKTDDEIPLVTASGDYVPRMLLEAFGINVKNSVKLMEVGTDGKVAYAGTSENYKAYLKYMHQLYDEGLIDQTNFIDTADERKAKMQADAIGMIGEAPFLNRGAAIATDADMVWIGGLTSEVNDKQYVGISMGVQADVMAMIAAKSEYKEAVVRLIDYYYSDEGYVEGISGPLGVSWEYVEDAVTGYKIRKILRPESYVSDESFRAGIATINNGISMFSNLEFIGRGVLYHLTDEKLQSKEVVETYGWAALAEIGMRREGNEMVYNMYPLMSYTADEAASRTTYNTEIENYITSITTQFITGEADIDSGWNTYLGELEKMGLNNLLKIEQDAYDRYSVNVK